MTSSTVTPVWGPQKPRLDRSRETRYYTSIKKMGNQSRNGITKAEAPWIFTTVRPIMPQVERIRDTIRNPKFAPFRSKNFFDDGGRLIIEKSRWSFNDVNLTTPWKSDVRCRYGLVALLGGFHGSFPMMSEYPPSEDTTASQFHAQAYKALRPDRPALSLINAVIELKDLFSVTFNAIKNIKDIANYWLATSFGWAPLLSDIYKLVKSIINLDARLQYFIRNNGKPIRARKQIWTSSDSSKILDLNECGINRSTWNDFPNQTANTAAWRWSWHYSYSSTVWASAQFVYWMKDIELPRVQKFVQMGLLGLNPTPAAVWNAIPWTWLLDWFVNIGDILDNMSSSMGNRLVAQYFYVMRTTRRAYQWSGTDGFFNCSATHSFESKIREAGHPYGLAFGAALNPFQLSILASLGAQRF